jgi:hypothetical protein
VVRVLRLCVRVMVPRFNCVRAGGAGRKKDVVVVEEGGRWEGERASQMKGK